MKSALWIMIALCGAARAEFSKHEFERGLMGTRFSITVYAEDSVRAKTASDAAFSEAEAINAAASDYIADSELLRLCREPAGKPVKLSPLLLDLLEKSRQYAELTEGRFDPTLGPLTKLWRESRRRGTLPDPEKLAAARQACGWQALTLDRSAQTATLLKQNMRLDLGGIAKGYAADRMFDALRKSGFTRVCIAAGGDLRLGDPPPGKTGWTVGVRTFDIHGIAETRSLSNCGISTSGDLRQAITIDGTRYAHIVDPATGLGLTKPVAVTVIATDSTRSDALATAVCVMGELTGKEKNHWQVHAVLFAPAQPQAP
jgi:thiamine biosynthesis lipoprotein